VFCSVELEQNNFVAFDADADDEINSMHGLFETSNL